MLFTNCPQVLDTLIREFAADPQDLASACLLCIEAIEDARVDGQDIAKPVIRCNGHYISFTTEPAHAFLIKVCIYEQPNPDFSTDQMREATQANGEGPGAWIFEHDELIIHVPSHATNPAGAYWCHYIWFQCIEISLKTFCDASRLTPEIGPPTSNFPANGEGGPAESFPDTGSENHWEQP